MVRVLVLVLTTISVAAVAQGRTQAQSATAEGETEVRGRPAAPLSEADRGRLNRAAERLDSAQEADAAGAGEASEPRQPATTGEAGRATLGETEVRRTQLVAAAQGTGAVAQYLASEDILLTPNERELVFQAVADAEAVQRQTVTSGFIDPTDLERVRLAERHVVLTYWDSLDQEEKPEILAPYQLGYVFEERFSALSEAVLADAGTDPTLAAERIELARDLQLGAELAAELSRTTDLPRTPGMDDLLASFDRVSQMALQGPFNPALAKSLQAISADVGQHTQLIALNLAAVALTVRTVRRHGESKQVNEGYDVRYELFADDVLDKPLGKSLSGTTTVTDHLGPYNYVFWADDKGRPASEKKNINLGDPLQASREIEIVLLEAEPKP